MDLREFLAAHRAYCSWAAEGGPRLLDGDRERALQAADYIRGAGNAVWRLLEQELGASLDDGLGLLAYWAEAHGGGSLEDAEDAWVRRLNQLLSDGAETGLPMAKLFERQFAHYREEVETEKRDARPEGTPQELPDHIKKLLEDIEREAREKPDATRQRPAEEPGDAPAAPQIRGPAAVPRVDWRPALALVRAANRRRNLPVPNGPRLLPLDIPKAVILTAKLVVLAIDAANMPNLQNRIAPGTAGEDVLGATAVRQLELLTSWLKAHVEGDWDAAGRVWGERLYALLTEGIAAGLHVERLFAAAHEAAVGADAPEGAG